MRTPEDIHDELLVIRCQDGEHDALAELVDRWQPRLIRHALRLTNNPDGAEEAVQGTWVAIVRGVHQVNDPACFRRWAYQILTRKCADWIRLRQRQRAKQDRLVSDPAGEESLDEGITNDIAALRKAIKRLPDDRRLVLVMFYLEGMSLQEIAHSLSLPVGTVKSRLHYARKQLQETMQRRES